jgi:hypothetical protein
MKQPRALICPNCGALVPAPEPANATALPREVICPTCQLHISMGASPGPRQITIDDLEAQLSALVERGLASELPPDELVHMLSNALTVVAESVRPDRHLFVAVFDLGVMGDVSGPRQFPDVADVLRRPESYGYGSERRRS